MIFNSIYNRLLLFNINLNILSIRSLFRELIFIPSNLKPKRSIINNKRKIVFVLIFKSHLKQALPILKKLKKNNVKFSIVTVRDKFETQLSEFKNDVCNINNFYGLFDYFLGCFFQIYNYSYSVIKQDKLRAYYIMKLFKISYLIERAFIKLIEKNDIKKIILFKGDGVEALTVTSLVKAKYKTIKLISIQHGVIGVSKIHEDLYLDEFWVWSDFFKTRLLQSKVGCNIKIVGDPTKDILFKSIWPIKNKKNDNINKILFLPNSGNSFTQKSHVLHSCKIISDFSKKNNNFKVMVKPHPGDINNLVENFFLKNQSKANIINRHDDVIKNNFYDADLIVINNSGIGNESAIFGIPIIIIAENVDQLWVNQYQENKIAEISLNYKEFKKSIEKILSKYSIYSKNCIQFAETMYAFRGESLEKILNLIKSK